MAPLRAEAGGGCGIDALGCDDGSVIDIIVFYTSFAREKAGTTAAIEDVITTAVMDTNTAYTNSQIDTLLRLVHMGEIDHGDPCVDLGGIRFEWDGFHDEIHEFRNALRADMVAVMFDKTGDPDCQSSAAIMHDESPHFEKFAFSKTDWTLAAADAYTFAHEVGHNMGCSHRRVDYTNCVGNCACQPGICEFSFGYQITTSHRTIMANGSGTRVPHFSNPDVDYFGDPTGVAPPSCDSAHNALSVNTTRDTVSNFRQSCDPTDTTTRASYDYFLFEGHAGSREISLSDDRHFVSFTSNATTFGAQGTFSDIIVYNRESGLVSLASNTAGAATGDSFASDISGDGHFIAFASKADNLVDVGANPNNLTDIYVREQFGFPRIKRISLDSNENLANDDCDAPSISHNGRYAVFQSNATNLVTGDTNLVSDIFVRDRDGNQDLVFDDPADSDTERVSISTASVQADGPSRAPSISRSSEPLEDGRYVAFESDATNLLDDGSDTNGHTDIFVRDTAPPGATIRVSVSSSSEQGNDPSSTPSISGDGQRIAFQSTAKNLVPGDSNKRIDIFVRDLSLQQTFRVSISSNGDQADGDSFAPAISRNGRFVAFHSDATNLVGEGVDTNGQSDVFVHDITSGETVRVSVDSLGMEATGGPSSFAAISDDGRFIGYGSDATNLVPGDANGFRDVFFRDRGSMCVGDFNGDFVVGAFDLALLLGNWGPVPGCPPFVVYDLDFDCDVGAGYLAILLGNWGLCL